MDNDTQQQRKELQKAFFAGMDGHDGNWTPERVRALMTAIWGTAHIDGLDRDTMLADLSLLSGFACAALLDYVKLMEKEDGKPQADNG